MTAYKGQIGTAHWPTGERPYDYRGAVIYLDPNGNTPLVGLTAKMRKERTTDPVFYWYTNKLDDQEATITGVYSDAALASAITMQQSNGAIIFFKMSAADAANFRPGMQVLGRLTTDLTLDCNAKVLGVIVNGASSYVQAKLLEADNNSTSNDIGDANRLQVIGTINPEMGERPEAVWYDNTEWSNYTQIFRWPIEISRTMKKTRLRTGNAYDQLRRRGLVYHAISMERAFLFGVATTATASNGHTERTTQGIIDAVKTSAAANVDDFPTTHSGSTWLSKGEEWFDGELATIYKYGSRRKMAFTGTTAMNAINRLAKSGGQINLTPMTNSYGLAVMRWIHPFGELDLLVHPLFSHNTITAGAMLILEPSLMRYRYIDDTMYLKDPKNKADWENDSGVDGIREEWLTECGLEYHNIDAFGWLTGVGTDG